MTDPFDPQGLIAVLVRLQVDFVVIGGLAATFHGAAIPTVDLDIIYERSRENLERLAKALQELTVRLRQAEDVPFRVDARSLRNGDRFTFTTPLGDFDCLGTASGAPDYAHLRSRAKGMTFGSSSIKIATLDDLIAMKQTTGRAKDVAKLAELLELRKLVGDQAPTPS